MLTRTHRALCTAALATVAAVACAPASSSSRREPLRTSPIAPLTPTSRVIDAARIERSGSQSALDAVRAFVPHFRFTDAGALTSLGGASAAVSRGPMRVMVDGHPIGDVESLRMIPAREIVAIHVLSAPDATVRFGPSYTGGAIVIQTQAAFRRL